MTGQGRDREQLQALWRHRATRTAVVALALTALVTAALGGFGRAQSAQKHPQSGAGARVDTGALALTPLRAWLTDAQPGRPPDRSGQRYLVLQLRAENLTESGIAAIAYLQQDLVWLPDGRSGERRADVLLRADDHGFDVTLQPRLPTTLDLVWKLRAGERLAPGTAWGTYRRDYVARTYLTGETAWIQQQPDTRLLLTVDDRTGTATP